jgi:hypothetical protein
MNVKQGYTLCYTNLMRGFTVKKFNKRTMELIGRPELAQDPRIQKIEAAGSICGIQQVYSLFEIDL